MQDIHTYFYRSFYQPTQAKLRARIGMDVVFAEAKVSFGQTHGFEYPLEYTGFLEWYYKRRGKPAQQASVATAYDS